MREWVARDMVVRGEHFAAAAILLKRHGGHGYVWRHNFCQAVELVMKGLLLLRNFDGEWPRMRKYGHRLVLLADAVAAAYNFRAPTGQLRAELEGLDSLYGAHLLRYASGLGALVNPDTIPYERVMIRLVAVQRLSRRKVSKSGLGLAAT